MIIIDNIELQWDRMKRMGKAKYILYYWVLLFGLGVPLLSIVLELIKTSIKGESYYLNLNGIFAQAFTCAIIGIFFGRLKWSATESLIHVKKIEEKKLNVEIDFCYHCGSELEEENNICPACNKELDV